VDFEAASMCAGNSRLLGWWLTSHGLCLEHDVAIAIGNQGAFRFQPASFAEFGVQTSRQCFLRGNSASRV